MIYNRYHRNVPPDAVYVGRPTKWGNPFLLGRDGTRAEVMVLFEEYMANNPKLRIEAQRELRGRDLVCSCAPLPCHADILHRIANAS